MINASLIEMEIESLVNSGRYATRKELVEDAIRFF